MPAIRLKLAERYNAQGADELVFLDSRLKRMHATLWPISWRRNRSKGLQFP